MEGDESYRRTSFDGSKRLREDNRRLREDNQRLLQAVHQNASSSSSSAEATGPTLAVYNTANAELERKNEMLSKQAELLMHELDEAHNAVRHRIATQNEINRERKNEAGHSQLRMCVTNKYCSELTS